MKFTKTNKEEHPLPTSVSRRVVEKYQSIMAVPIMGDIIEYLHGRDIDGKVIIDDDMKAKMVAYMNEYCVL